MAKSILQQMIEEAKSDGKKKIEITIGTQKLLFKRLTNAAEITREQNSAVKQCKVLLKIKTGPHVPFIKELDKQQICESILLSSLNLNDPQQSAVDFMQLAVEAGPWFNTIVNGLEFMMKPKAEIEAELIDDMEKN